MSVIGKDLKFYQSGRLKMICGGPATGKTTLIKKLVEEGFEKGNILLLGLSGEYPDNWISRLKNLVFIDVTAPMPGKPQTIQLAQDVAKYIKPLDDIGGIFIDFREDQVVWLALGLAKEYKTDIIMTSDFTPEEFNELVPVNLVWRKIGVEELFND
jgi:GTPase SAR1 family protein